MRTTSNARSAWALTLSALILATSGACGPSASDNTPTPGVDAIYTAAFGTFQAQQATQLALTPPTATPTPSPFPTLSLPSPIATIPFAIPTSSSGSTASGCNNAAYVADVTIPDGTSVKPGASFDKTWTLLNTGSCPWSTSYKLAYFSGEGMSGSAAAVPAAVNSGSQVNMTVHLVAPSTAGSYTGYWRMQTDQGTGFGGSVYVQITVSGTAGASSTAGPSPTPTKTISPADLTATASAAPTAGGDHTISGETGVNGNLTIKVVGKKINDTVAIDGSTWSYTVPDHWDGTVTPSKSGFTFSPTSCSFSDVTSDRTCNFTASSSP